MRHTTLLLVIVAVFGMIQAEGLSIKGRVLDKTGAGISQATVRLQPAGITVLTGNDGRVQDGKQHDTVPSGGRNDLLVEQVGRGAEYHPLLFHLQLRPDRSGIL